MDYKILERLRNGEKAEAIVNEFTKEVNKALDIFEKEVKLQKQKELEEQNAELQSIADALTDWLNKYHPDRKGTVKIITDSSTNKEEKDIDSILRNFLKQNKSFF